MTKKIVLSAIAASVMASSALATNGDNLIATGAKARAMGGTQIAASFGAESAMYNPAMIAGAKDSLSASVTYFDPSVETYQSSNITSQTALETSATAASIIPNLTYVKSINKDLTVGLAVYGSAGMGTDWTSANQTSTYKMRTALSLLKVAVPVAYKTGALSIGIAPVLLKGELDINFNTGGSSQDTARSDDMGFGFELGVNYEVNKDLNVAALYKSELAMEYTNQIGSASKLFNVNSGSGIASGDKLNQPAEMGLGVSYKLGKGVLNADFKQVNWGDAEGYADFAWENQTVMAIGYSHMLNDALTLRVGYNKADNPIAELDGSSTATGANYNNAVINFFNITGFPGVVEEHITLGASYAVKKGFDIDFALVLASETTNSYSIAEMADAFDDNNPANQTQTTGSINNTHSQISYTVGVNYNF